jgi:hypothetical protein
MRKDIDLNPAESNPGYEKRDVNARGILYFVIVLFLLLVASLISMRSLFGYFSTTQPLGPAASPFTSVRALPPEPRLQVQPVEDLNIVRQGQEDLLGSYGWVDRAGGKVHIPIDRAMELVIERGLPARQGATQTAQQAGTSAKEQEK